MKESGNNAFVTLSFTMSVLALLVSGFALYQAMSSRQVAMTTVSNNPTGSPQAAPQTAAPQTAASQIASSPTAPQTANTASNTTQSTSNTAPVSGIQPKQFVSPAFEKIGEVELLSVKRIQDPKTSNRDVVNVQFRLRRLSSDSAPVLNQTLSASEATVRNPETSETYQPVDFKNATDPILINMIRVNASVDGYVWMRIPENVSTIDIFLPETQAFKNVPIAN